MIQQDWKFVIDRFATRRDCVQFHLTRTSSKWKKPHTKISLFEVFMFSDGFRVSIISVAFSKTSSATSPFVGSGQSGTFRSRWSSIIQEL